MWHRRTVSYFVVKLNGNTAICAGSPDVSVLTAAVIATVRGPAQLTVSGLRSAGGENTHWFWPPHTLAQSDQIEIAYLSEGRQTEPSSTVVEPERTIQELLAELRSRSELIPTDVAKIPRFASGARSHRLSVATSAGSRVEATLGNSENLQAVVCLAQKQCKIEVDSLTVQSDGSTLGKRWLAEPLALGEAVSLTYAT